jgi:hypothetical protein
LKVFGEGAKSAGAAMDSSMTEARGGLMLTEEAIGVHLPRELNRLIATIPGVGAAFSMMLPLIGVVAAIAVIGKLVEKHRELKESAAKFADDQTKLGTVGANAMQSWEEKILDAGIAIDALKGNHVDKLKKELEKIDHQTMHELVQQFAELDKAAGVAFADIKTSWYQFGEGSEGAKDALDKFSIKYAALMTDPKNKGAAQDLLAGTLASAEKYLAIQDQLRASQGVYVESAVAYARANNKAVDSTDNAYKAQQQLVAVLKEKVALTQEAAKAEGAEVAVKVLEDEQSQIINLIGRHDNLIQKRKEAAKAEETYESEMLHGPEEIATAMAKAWDEQVALNEKVADSYKKVADAKNETTASAQRTQVKDNASLGIISKQQEAQMMLEIDQREAKNYQASLDDQLNTLKQHLDNTTALAAQAKGTNQESETVKAQAQAQIAYNGALADGVKQTEKLNAAVLKDGVDVANADRSWQQFFNQMSKFRPLSESIQDDYKKMADQFSTSIAKSIVEGKSLGKAMQQVGREILEMMVQNTMMTLLMDDKKKLSAAKTAGAKAYEWAVGDVGPIAATIVAAGAFAGAMAFETGGEIPGSGPVPIIAHGGETVVTKNLTDQIKSGAANGGSDSGGKGGDSHVHLHASAMDAEGMDRVLQKHASTINKHVTASMRKQNR